jgi:hypothetical protein
MMQAQAVLSFLLSKGLVDADERVRPQMVSAGMAIIDKYGATHAAAMLPILEAVLDTAPAKGEDLRAFDWRREGAVSRRWFPCFEHETLWGTKTTLSRRMVNCDQIFPPWISLDGFVWAPDSSAPYLMGSVSFPS